MRRITLACTAIAGVVAAPPTWAQAYPPPTPLPPPAYAPPPGDPPGATGAPLPVYRSTPGSGAAPSAAYPPPPGYPPRPSYGAAPQPTYSPPPGYPPPPAYGAAPQPTYSPPTGYAPPPPGYAPPGYAPPGYAPPAYGAAPPPGYGYPPAVDGRGVARPGHEPGVGLSYPLSPNASNIDRGNTRSTIAPSLPSPGLGANAPPVQFLQAARGALAAGRTGEAQQAMEMAQTRLLDRSVAYDATGTPSANPAVAQISEALRALAAGDRARALQIVDAVIPQAAGETAPRQ